VCAAAHPASSAEVMILWWWVSRRVSFTRWPGRPVVGSLSEEGFFHRQRHNSFGGKLAPKRFVEFEN
jgi:hypothetical protein